MRKKCYIAGKIGDLPPEEYLAKFAKAKAEVIKLGHQPVSPIDLDHYHDKSWASYMKADIKALLDCDYVYALRDWRRSPGAIIEVNLALQVGITIIQQP